jgi:hypothetical protein
MNFPGIQRTLFELLLCTTLLAPHWAHAAVFDIYLYYNAGTGEISLDKKVPIPIVVNKDKSLSISEYYQQTTSGAFEYVFLDSTGNIVDSKQFTVQNGTATLEIPYFSTAVSFGIRKTESEKFLFTSDISSSSTCNNNGICEVEKGENFNTCTPDCANGHVKYSAQTQQQLEVNKGKIIDPKTEETILKDLRAVQVETSSTNSPQTNAQINTSGNLTLQVLLLGTLIVGVLVGIMFGIRWFLRRRS